MTLQEGVRRYRPMGSIPQSSSVTEDVSKVKVGLEAIDEIETAIKRIMDEEIRSPILTIPGISYRRKYQEQNLSPVEEEYLESIKNILGLTASEE